MDPGFETCQIFTTVNKKQYMKFGILYLKEKYLWLKSKFFPGKLYTTNGVFYLSIDPSEVTKCLAFCKHSGEDQTSHDYIILLNHRYNKYLNHECSAVNDCTSVTAENDTLGNQLLTFVKSIVKEYY